MRDAKEDAYRNLLERVGSVSLKYASRQQGGGEQSTQNKMAMTVETSGSVKGVRLIHLIPVDELMYEAKLEANLDTVYSSLDGGDQPIKMLEDAGQTSPNTGERNQGNRTRFYYLQEP